MWLTFCGMADFLLEYDREIFIDRLLSSNPQSIMDFGVILGWQPRIFFNSLLYVKVLWSLPLLLFWSLMCLYLSSKFCIFALHWFPVWMDPMPCSLSSLFSSQAIDFQMEELCRLLMGWWSLHTHFNREKYRWKVSLTKGCTQVE